MTDKLAAARLLPCQGGAGFRPELVFTLYEHQFIGSEASPER